MRERGRAHGGARLGGAPCWETGYEVPFTDGLKPYSLFSPLLLSERDSHVFLTPRRGCKWHYTVFERLGKGIWSTEGRGHCLQPHLKPVAVDFSGQLGQEIKTQGKKARTETWQLSGYSVPKRVEGDLRLGC